MSGVDDAAHRTLHQPDRGGARDGDHRRVRALRRHGQHRQSYLYNKVSWVFLSLEGGFLLFILNVAELNRLKRYLFSSKA